MNPCMECKNRYGREYSSECDDFCDYAKTCQENIRLRKELEDVSNFYDKVLEQLKIMDNKIIQIRNIIDNATALKW